MINWANLSQNSGMTKKQFKLFVKMIEKGDHICTQPRLPTCTTVCLDYGLTCSSHHRPAKAH